MIIPRGSTHQRQFCSHKLTNISGENYFIHVSRTRYRLIMMKEKQKKSLKGPLTSFTLKACSIKKRSFRHLVNSLTFGDFVTEMESQPLDSADKEQ